MFVKRFLLLAIVLVAASAEGGSKQSKQNKNGAIRVIKTDDDVYALAGRWAAPLLAGWTVNGTVVNPARILGEYAPDGAVTVHSSKGGFATGSQLLATVANTPLTTNALRNTYFQTFLGNKPVCYLAGITFLPLLYRFRGVCAF
jgi:hypothetical protein